MGSATHTATAARQDGPARPSALPRRHHGFEGHPECIEHNVRSARREVRQSRHERGAVLAQGSYALVGASQEFPQAFARSAGGVKRCGAELDDDLNRPVREDTLGACKYLELMALDIDLHQRDRVGIRTADIIEPPAL